MGMHGDALLLLCLAFSCSTLELGATSFLVTVPRLGGLGHQNLVQVSLAIGEAAFAASGA